MCEKNLFSLRGILLLKSQDLKKRNKGHENHRTVTSDNTGLKIKYTIVGVDLTQA